MLAIGAAMQGDVWEDYATLVADLAAYLQAEAQTGVRVVPRGELGILQEALKSLPAGPNPSGPNSAGPNSAWASSGAPRPASPASPASLGRTAPPVSPPVQKQPVQPATPVVARVLPTPAVPVNPANVGPARAGWARYTRDPSEELERFRVHEVGDCRRCERWAGRSSVLVGDGPVRARLVIFGSAPSAEEDRLGKIFVGAAGEMLEKMLENVLSLKRSEIFVVPTVMCRGLKAPTVNEFEACRPLVLQQLALVKPRAALAMGPDALAFLGPDARRGEWSVVDGVEVMPTWHPAELLANPNYKRATFEHLKEVQRKLSQTSLF